MKAKIRKTGEVVDIVCFNCNTRRCKYDSVSYIDSKGAEHTEEPFNYYWDFEEISDLDATIDWEQRRYEVAKELLKIIITQQNETSYSDERLAFMHANRLIKILKED